MTIQGSPRDAAPACLPRITVRLSSRCGPGGALIFVAEAAGQRIQRQRGSVVGDMARLLLAEGHDPAALLNVVDRDTGLPRLVPQRLSRWARTTIEENHARAVIAGWATDDNTRRPHSAIGYMTPAAYAAALTPQRPSTLRSKEGSAPMAVATAALMRKS